MIISGFAILLVGLASLLWITTADAANTYCGRRTNSNFQSGVSVQNYIDVWTDPACTGNRYVAYDFYGTSSAVMDHQFIDFARAWLCGSLAMNVQDIYVYNTNWTNIWSGWAPSNTCGFQADQQIAFWKAGSVDVWTYINW